MPPTGPVYLSISADLLNREGLEAEIGEGARYQIEPPAPARAETVEAIAGKLGEATGPILMFGDGVWRDGAAAAAVELAELLEAPVFASRQIFANFPNRHALYCGTYPVPDGFTSATGLRPDLLTNPWTRRRACRYAGATFSANGLPPSAFEIEAIARCARTLLPAASSGGETTAMPNFPGETATMPPPTPLLAGSPVWYSHLPESS